MSQAAIPVPLNCSTNCVPGGTSGPPGVPGHDGAPGAPGQNGVDAYATVANLTPDPQPVMPVEGGTELVPVTGSTAAFFVGMLVQVETWGTLRVDAVASNSLTLFNLEDSGTGAYADNAAPGTPLAAATKITPSGPQGVTGPMPAGALLSVNNLTDVANTAASRANLGLGTAATFTQGNLNGQIPVVYDTPGLTDGEVVFANTIGLETKSASDARTALGLGSAATFDEGVTLGSIPAVDVANLTANQAVFATASGIQSVTAAVARGLLGVSAQDMLLFRDQRSNGVDSSGFTASDWFVTPLNTEVIDTGGNGSINGSSEMTLAAGTYRYNFAVVCFGGEQLQGRLYNVTAGVPFDTGAENSYGQVVKGASTDQLVATGQGRFTLSGSTVITLQGFRFGGGGATWGDAAGFTGSTEVYSFLQLVKE